MSDYDGADPRWTLYYVWLGMMSRCYRSNHTYFHRYGGRGITVAESWKKYQQFRNDVEQEIGRRPSLKHTLDRLNNDGNYEPRNIRWATQREQRRNTSCNIFVTVNGVRQVLMDWAHQTGIGHGTLLKRHQSGWSDDAVINTPLRVQRRPRRG